MLYTPTSVPLVAAMASVALDSPLPSRRTRSDRPSSFRITASGTPRDRRTIVSAINAANRSVFSVIACIIHLPRRQPVPRHQPHPVVVLGLSQPIDGPVAASKRRHVNGNPPCRAQHHRINRAAIHRFALRSFDCSRLRRYAVLHSGCASPITTQSRSARTADLRSCSSIGFLQNMHGHAVVELAMAKKVSRR